MYKKIAKSIARKKILINGVVQGVGFRPFIHNLAKEHNLSGLVKNTINGVYIEVEGCTIDINNFVTNISEKAPPLSDIISVETSEMEPVYSDIFEIITSGNSSGNETFISPDVSICDDCLNEMFDKNNRRYLYPFINCTNCGPRLTIIHNIPYDRKFTTMAHFEMCELCSNEYENPHNRRFHAQPNACPVCGPKIWLTKSDGELITDNSEEVLSLIADKLSEGKIIAIKGLGGYHLACDARNKHAVETLRLRKGREAKPFAIMSYNINEVKKIAEVNTDEENLLKGFQKPIVLLKKKNRINVAESVAPDNTRLGIMLPYTPLHYLVMNEMKKKDPVKEYPLLVMTSANFSEEPIEINNESALKRLSGIADYFAFHNREILIRADDSVMININNRNRFFRRSRGYVPKPLLLNEEYPKILAVGAELKNTICVIKNNHAFLSQHIGDLTNISANTFFTETITHQQKIINCEADYLAYDLHPNYLSSIWAKKSDIPKKYDIQHHHAHMASCMAENNLDEDVIGVIFDGTGYGYDNKIWGGEFLIGGYTSFQRVMHLPYIQLPGGDKAIEEPWRIALSYLHKYYGKDLPKLPFLENKPVKNIIEMLHKNINSPLSCGAGRLFDAISVIAGGPEKIRYEAEAAIYLTQKSNHNDLSLYELEPINTEQTEINLDKLFSQIVEDVLNNKSIEVIGAKFHNTLAELIQKVVNKISSLRAINKIVLSGGVFQNEILSAKVENKLSDEGFDVYYHTKLPVNDGGISLGQAVIAGELIKNNLNEVKYIN